MLGEHHIFQAISEDEDKIKLLTPLAEAFATGIYINVVRIKSPNSSVSIISSCF